MFECEHNTYYVAHVLIHHSFKSKQEISTYLWNKTYLSPEYVLATLKAAQKLTII